jgi:hypothetical protein
VSWRSTGGSGRSAARWRWRRWRGSARHRGRWSCRHANIARGGGGRGRGVKERQRRRAVARHRRSVAQRGGVSADGHDGADPVPPSRTLESAILARSAECRSTSREIKGQESVKRAAMSIAAAGGHNLLDAGPGGHGQDDGGEGAARAFCRRCRPSEAVEVTRVYSAAGLSSRLVGRGAGPHERPGAHAAPHGLSARRSSGAGRSPGPARSRWRTAGCLFLDELPEFTAARARDAPPAAGRPRGHDQRGRTDAAVPGATSCWSRR